MIRILPCCSDIVQAATQHHANNTSTKQSVCLDRTEPLVMEEQTGPVHVQVNQPSPRAPQSQWGCQRLRVLASLITAWILVGAPSHFLVRERVGGAARLSALSPPRVNCRCDARARKQNTSTASLGGSTLRAARVNNGEQKARVKVRL